MTSPAPLATRQANRHITTVRHCQAVDAAAESLSLDLTAVWARARTDTRLTIALDGRAPDAFEERVRTVRTEYLRLLALGNHPAGPSSSSVTRTRATGAATIRRSRRPATPWPQRPLRTRTRARHASPEGG